jgi:hypothetical protein
LHSMSAIDPLSVGIGFVIGAVSGAVGMMVADWFREWRNRLKIRVDVGEDTPIKTATRTQIIVGFGISVEQGEKLTNVYPKFNQIRHPWYDRGKPKETVDMLANQDPSWFFPYSITLDYVEDLSKISNVEGILKREEWSNHGVQITVTELITKQVLLSIVSAMPKSTHGFDLRMHRKICHIRINLVGEGITRKTNWEADAYLTRLKIGKLEKGVPSLDTSECGVTYEVTAKVLSSISSIS